MSSAEGSLGWRPVDCLPDELGDQLDSIEAQLTTLYSVPDQRRPLPAFVGIGDSGRSDVSDRVNELLSDGFGGAPQS